MSSTYDYARPIVTVDCVIFGLDDEGLKLLLIEREQEPVAGSWALPGGFVQMDESLDEAARRELQEEAGVNNIYMEQLYTFGEVERDPRGRVITVVYFALVNIRDQTLQAATDAKDAAWFALSELPELAFDHARIITMAQERLRGKVRYHCLGFHLLPVEFTLTELQQLYETILETPLDKRNFRKKALSTGVIKETGKRQTGVSHRAAMLYRFDEETYRRLTAEGVEFQI